MPVAYFCWHCYARSDRPQGRCEECGGEIAAPEGASFDDRLLWALQHPLSERRMIAARALGRRRVARSREPLRELATGGEDPYLAAAALRALVELDGVDAHRGLLDELTASGAAPLSHAARQLAAGR